MRDLLKRHFGYNEFLPLQEEIISTVLEERDALVLMPTGGGKLLCYQLPAMHFEGLNPGGIVAERVEGRRWSR